MPRHFLRAHYDEIVSAVERALALINCRIAIDKIPCHYYQSQGPEAGLHFKIVLPNGECTRFAFLKNQAFHWSIFFN